MVRKLFHFFMMKIPEFDLLILFALLWGFSNGHKTQSISGSECKSRCDGKEVTVPYSEQYYSALLTPARTPKTQFCILTHPITVDNIISRQIRNRGVYGHGYLFERLFLANSKDAFFLDAGANIGYHTLQAAAIGVHVISWEPNPMNIALLESSIAKNCYEKWILLENAALGTPAQAGTMMEMRVHAFSPGLSTLANTSIIESNDMTFGPHHFKVSLVTMDSTLHSICALKKIKRKSIISLLKIDVEGFEEHALGGASELFDDRIQCFEKPRHVHIEIFPTLLHAAGSTSAAPLQWLGSKGYELFVGLGNGLGGKNLVKTRSAQLELLSLGCTHIYGGTFAVPVKSIGGLIQFLVVNNIEHLDVLAQRLSPSVPLEIDTWNNQSVFYAREG